MTHDCSCAVEHEETKRREGSLGISLLLIFFFFVESVACFVWFYCDFHIFQFILLQNLIFLILNGLSLRLIKGEAKNVINTL